MLTYYGLPLLEALDELLHRIGWLRGSAFQTYVCAWRDLWAEMA